MPKYVIPGFAIAGVAYQTASQVNCTGTTKRGWVYEIQIDQAKTPPPDYVTPDTDVKWDLSRISATGAGAYTAFTPVRTDPADGASVMAAGISATFEATTITANSSLFYEGINQRNSLRWITDQESQGICWPAVSGSGLILRCLSATFTATGNGSIYYRE